MQHNDVKFTNVMQSLLQYAVKCKINIVLIQKPWIQKNKLISHSNFINIISNINNTRSRVCTFVPKQNSKLMCISKIDIINDSDLQILEIVIKNIRNLKLINIYNEKSITNDDAQYIIDHLFFTLKFGNEIKLILNENMNAHHE